MADRVQFGMDAREYFDVANQIERRHNNLGESINRSNGHAAKSHEPLLVSSHRVASQLGIVTREIAADGNIAGAALEGLEHAFNLPIAPLAVLAAGGIFLEKLSENAREAKHSLHEMHREFDKNPSGNIALGSEASISQQIDKEAELLKKAQEKRSGILGKTNVLLGAATSRADVREEARRRKSLLQQALRDRAAESTGIAQEDAFGSTREADRRKSQAESEARIAEIRANKNLSKGTKSYLEEQENARLQVQLYLVEKIHDAKQRAAELTGRIADIQVRGGDNVDVDSSRARLQSALDEQRRAQNDDDKQTANAKVAVAGAELQLALRLRDISQEQFQMALARSEIAGLTARASVDATPEQRSRQDLQARVQLAEKEVRSARERYDIEEKEGRLTRTAIAARGNALSEQERASAALKIFDKDTAFTHEQSLNAAKNQTTQLELQAAGQDHLARLAGIAAEAEQKRAQYLHDGRADLTEQVNKQEQLSRLQENANEVGKDPATKYQEYLGRLKKEQNLRTAAAQEKDENDRHRRGSRKDGEKKQGPLSDEEFEKQFKPLQQQAVGYHASKHAAADADKSADPVISKMESLITTLNGLPAKIGVL